MKIVCRSDCDAPPPTLFKDGIWTSISTILVILMPKCALCWASYLSFLGFFGLSISYKSWFLPLMLITFIITLAKLIFKALKTKYYVTLVTAILSGLLIIIQKILDQSDIIAFVGLVLMMCSLLLDSLQRRNRIIFIKK